MVRAHAQSADPAPTNTSRSWLLFAGWAIAIVVVLMARIPAYWTIAPSVLAAIASAAMGRNKSWMVYAGAACAIAVVFIWTSALFTYSLDPASH